MSRSNSTLRTNLDRIHRVEAFNLGLNYLEFISAERIFEEPYEISTILRHACAVSIRLRCPDLCPGTGSASRISARAQRSPPRARSPGKPGSDAPHGQRGRARHQ